MTESGKSFAAVVAVCMSLEKMRSSYEMYVPIGFHIIVVGFGDNPGWHVMMGFLFAVTQNVATPHLR